MIVALSIMLTACTTSPHSQTPITPIQLKDSVQEMWSQTHKHFIGFPTPMAFSVCHDMSCHRVSHLHFLQQEWHQVVTLFSAASASAEDERQSIAAAIGLMETLVGKKIGTSSDLAKNALVATRKGQLDCIDEATNSTVYLRLLETEGLLQWHQVGNRTSRGLMIGRFPHNTATLIDTTTQTRYAIDSWYFANGEPPAIVELNTWKAGWQPDAVQH
jgi:hypothetical protein